MPSLHEPSPLSCDSHGSSILLEEHSESNDGATGPEGEREEGNSGRSGRVRGLKNKLSSFALKLSSKTKQPNQKNRFQFKGASGKGEGAMAEDAAPQGKKLGQKFSATFMARKNLAGPERLAGKVRGAVRRGHGAGSSSGGSGRVQDLSALAASISQRSVAGQPSTDAPAHVAAPGEEPLEPMPPVRTPRGSSEGGRLQEEEAREEAAPGHSGAEDGNGQTEPPIGAGGGGKEEAEAEAPAANGTPPPDSAADPRIMDAINSPLTAAPPAHSPPPADPVRRPSDSGSSVSEADAGGGASSSAGRARRPTWRDGAPGLQQPPGEGGAPQRRGVYIMLRGDNVELVGEKGTKVPNTTVKEITLEVECSLCISLEFSRLKGWQAAKAVEFEVLSLHSKVKGNSMPLPKTLIKTMLNLVLPKVVRRSILPAMPKELGEYLLESGGGLGVAGEIVIQGPPLEALTADLCPARQPERPP
eukprot:jgi/Tetstr1/429840/TSEL_019707.t1